MKHPGMAMMLGVLFVTCLLLVSVGPVWGQEAPRANRDPVVFKAQLLEFAQQERRLVREIQALPVDDSIPVDPVVHRHAYQHYVLIRTALAGMEQATSVQTSYDPMLNLAKKKVEEAWNLARFPVDNTGVPRAEYIATSLRDLTRAIQLVHQALTILP